MRAAKYFGNANYVLGTRDPRRRAVEWTTQSQFCAAARRKKKQTHTHKRHSVIPLAPRKTSQPRAHFSAPAHYNRV